MLLVRLTRGGVVETETRLEQGDLRVGRASDNEIALKDPDRTLSRHHAELRHEGDHWVYLDLNSANGSWVGERRVTRQELVPGIAVTLGDYQLTLAKIEAALDTTSPGADATQVFRRDTQTLRPTSAPKPPVAAAVKAEPAPAVVGGALGVAKPAAPARPASPPMIRRILIFGSIGVFGAFAVILALLLRPDGETPAPESAAPTTSAPAPAPAPPPAPAPALNETPSAPVVAETVAPPPPPPVVPANSTSTPPAAAPVMRPRPVDTDPDAATIPARPGETASALQQRRTDVRRRYALAQQRLSGRQFAEARDLFAALSREVPKFRDVNARLAESEDALRQQAAENFKAAAKLEEGEQWTEAITAYERLRPFASALPGLTDALDRTRKKMHDAGADALTRARQFDSRGRVPEAIAWYQRAVNWLAPDHPGLEAARQRLAQLTNRP
jgi:hypothetical protein